MIPHDAGGVELQVQVVLRQAQLDGPAVHREDDRPHDVERLYRVRPVPPDGVAVVPVGRPPHPLEHAGTRRDALLNVGF
jgi:hypothetical protein